MKKCFCLFLVFIYIYTVFNLTIYAYTVDDVRELVGKQRIDSIYTSDEIQMIITQYESLEEQNMILRMFEIGKELGINDELEEQYKELNNSLKEARDELANSFLKGSPFDEVSENKSRVESIMLEISKLKDRGYDISVEYEPNIWEERYLEVQEIIKELGSYYDIGDLGDDLKGPLGDSFILSEVYGFHLDITENLVVFHDGIDLYGKNTERVYSQWNGVVSRVYKEENDKYIIEISHGENLKTVYKYLDSVDVKEGDFLNQYAYIGLLGESQEKSNNNEYILHFSIYLDNEIINPLYLYGQKGLKAFKTFVSNRPERYLEYFDVANNIVNINNDEKEEQLEEIIEYNKEEITKYNKEEIFNNFKEYQEELDKNKNKVK